MCRNKKISYLNLIIKINDTNLKFIKIIYNKYHTNSQIYI